jgi:imidazolonepropionase-like amidohydrolase
MTPMQAIVAATKNGALACRMQKDLGTVEVGKLADLLVLDADPLADISNIRKLRTVIKEGRAVDPNTLPTNPVWYRPVRSSASSQASAR